VIRIVVVAAYASVRAGLQVLLGDAEECVVSGEARGSAELERLLPELRPNVVLFDDNEDDRARLLDVISGGETGLVMLGDSRGGYRLLANAALPGWAYLLREADGPAIQGAVRAVAAGLVVLDRSLAPLLGLGIPLAVAGHEETVAFADEALTPREREVLQLAAEGLTTREIAEQLVVSTKTAEHHRASAMAKLNLHSQTELVKYAIRTGLIEAGG
jgi:two-component system, NarL family, response regulator NreC